MECNETSSSRRLPVLLLPVLLLPVLLMIVSSLGCRLAGQATSPVTAERLVSAGGYTVFSPEMVAATVAESEQNLADAAEADRRQDESCVDLYYRSANQTARVLAGPPGEPHGQAAWQTYHRALAGLLDSAQRYGRLDPRKQLVVRDPGQRVVPISYYGFSWRPADFSELQSAAEQETTEISRRYETHGLGLPLVGVRVADQPNELFFRSRQSFALTAVLRPVAGGDGGSVLEFYNPRAFGSVVWSGSQYELSRNLTAAYAATVNESPRQYLRGFTAPGDTSVQPKLIMVEPYQRGKIPVVFIHGLYSDPITWIDAANDLMAETDIYQRFQFWVFRYPTGAGMMESAAVLRERLRLAHTYYAPNHDDPALDQMVLVGHSLGGLVAKTQIVTSYDLIWNQIADQPFSALRAPPEIETRLARDFFFEPLPFVKQVVFIGTPFQGSALSRRLAGRIGSSLVRLDGKDDALYREVVTENSDVFKPIVTRKPPTSVDLLEPRSPLLAGLRDTPVNPAVRMHSIIGTGGLNVFSEPSDGVVTVTSARTCGVQSELLVPAKHEKLHRDPASIAEIARILRQHAAEVDTATLTANKRPQRADRHR